MRRDICSSVSLCASYCAIFLGIALSFASAQLAAQEMFPSKPIKLIVPLGTGGGTDTVVRIVAREMERELGQAVVVDNMPGVDGVLGTNAAAKAVPDGYTLTWGASTTLAANTFLRKSVTFDPVNDFVPLAMLGGVDTALIVPASLGVSNLADFVKLAKANPGKLAYGSGSTNAFLCGEVFKVLAGIDLLRVPYKATPPALIDLAEGRLQLLCEPIATSAALVKAGKLRLIAITSKARIASVPDIPTATEQGVPLVRFGWGGFYAPKGTPPAVVDKLSAAFLEVLRRPDVQQKIVEIGWVPGVLAPPEMNEALRNELQQVKNVVKAAKVEPE